MHICHNEFKLLPNGSDILRTESIYETIKTIGPDLGSVIAFATWLDQLAPFQPILTGEGLCYTFNTLNSRDIYSNEYA